MAYSPDPGWVAARGPPGRPSALSGNALGAASMLAWAAGFPAAEYLLQSWPPLALITARLLLAVTILIPVWMLCDGFGAIRRARWRRGVWVGGLSFGLGTYLLLLAQSLTDPVTVALIASSAPLSATLLEMAQRSRRLSWNFTLGMGASVLGGIIAATALAPAQLGLGAVSAIASVFLFSWGSMAAVRDFPELSPVGRSTITLAGALMLIGTVFLVARALGADVMPRADFTSAQAGQLAIYALAGMALSQVMWIASVGRLGVALASFHINLAPFYVMLLLLALGAAWSWPQAAGAAIVGLGVMIAHRR